MTTLAIIIIVYVVVAAAVQVIVTKLDGELFDVMIFSLGWPLFLVFWVLALPHLITRSRNP